MKSIVEFFKALLMVLFFLAVLAIPVSCEYQVWHECRQTNSWYYCTRVLDK